MYWGRIYFGVQAVAGAGWWVAVAFSPFVREATLGGLDPVAVALADVPLFVVGSALAAAGIRWAAWVATGWTLLVAVALAVYATVTTEAGWGVLLMAGAAGASAVALTLVVVGRIPTAWIASGPFAFRPALPRSTAVPHVVSTLAQIVVFWGFFLAVVPVVVVFLERRWQVGIPFPAVVPWIGAAVFVLACALGLWSAYTMSVLGRGTPLPSAMANTLVVAGAYRVIRNPMAVSGLVQGAAVGLVLSSWLVVVYALLGSLLWNYAVRPLEEADLEKRFGDSYRAYRDAVSCWVPRAPAVAAVRTPSR